MSLKTKTKKHGGFIPPNIKTKSRSTKSLKSKSKSKSKSNTKYSRTIKKK